MYQYVKNRILKIVGIIVLFGTISALVQFSSPNVADLDSFYHIKHAYLYRTQNLFDTSFPWTQYSVIKEYGADLWYGFHIFLVPFTYFPDLILGAKVAGALVTLLTLLFLGWALARLKIKYPFFWPLLFLISGPDVMYRLSMARPHNLSLALGLLVFSFFIAGRWPSVLASSAILAFIHPTMAWLPVLIAGTISLCGLIYGRPVEWPKILASLGGIAIGLLARPNPIGTLKLIYIQTIEIILVKINKIPLYFGREILDFDLRGSEFVGLLQNAGPALMILLIALVLFKVSSRTSASIDQKLKILSLTGTTLAAVFMMISLTVARRGYDYSVVLALVAASAIFTLYFTAAPTHSKKRLMFAAVILSGLLFTNSISGFRGFMAQAFAPDYLKESSLWLKNNTRPGEIVFNTRWDLFHGLFFWNTHNYYVNGMDPIFMYAYNPSLYWKNHYLAIDKAGSITCGKIKCTAEEAEDTHTALVDDFKASYLILRKTQTPSLYSHLAGEKKFQLVFENKNEAIFKIVPR